MKKLIFIFLFTVSICLHPFAKQSALLFTSPIQGNVQLLEAGNKHYCITRNVIYEIAKKKLVPAAVLQNNSNDAAVYNNNIVLATNSGLLLFNTKTNTITALLPAAVQGSINHVQTDNSNRIWFTKEYEGCFMVDDSNKVLQKIKVPATYALNFTPNGNIWVGTNVGLYKVPVTGSEIVRYAEEGIASNDLPDNLVERLFTDAESNVWVMMPGHISFIAADSEDELPDYEHVGKQDNELYDIAATASKKAYLFATAQGILLMYDIKYGEALYTGEIHQTVNEKAYQLTDAMIKKPASLQQEVVTKISTCGSETYFITSKGLWSVSTSKLNKRLSNQFKI